MEKINTQQFFVLTSLFILGSTIIYLPHIIIQHARQDAWISSIIALLFGLILITIYLKIFKIYPNQTFVQILQNSFGKRAGKIISFFMIVCFNFLICIFTLRDFGDFLTIQIIPETPMIVVHLIFLIVVSYAVKKGLEVIARTAQILFPVAIFFYLLSAVLLLNNSDVNQLLPIMANGWKPIVRASLPNIGFPYFDMFVLTILVPFVSAKTTAKPFYFGAILGGMMLAIATLYSLMVLGVEYSSSKIYTPYVLGAEINLAEVIQRVEVIISTIWYISTFIKMCLLVLTTAIGLQQVFNFQDYRLLILPLCLLLLPLSLLIMPNTSYWGIIFDVWTLYGSIFAFWLPIIILIIGLIRVKATKKASIHLSK